MTSSRFLRTTLFLIVLSLGLPASAGYHHFYDNFMNYLKSKTPERTNALKVSLARQIIELKDGEHLNVINASHKVAERFVKENNDPQSIENVKQKMNDLVQEINLKVEENKVSALGAFIKAAPISMGVGLLVTFGVYSVLSKFNALVPAKYKGMESVFFIVGTSTGAGLMAGTLTALKITISDIKFSSSLKSFFNEFQASTETTLRNIEALKVLNNLQ